MFAIRPIGFVFPFAGTTYTDVHVCTNGYVYVSNAGVPAPGAADFTPTTAEFVSGSPRFAPIWEDLNILAANNGQVYINSTAAKCTITWKNAVCYGTAAPIFDVQAQLFPTGEIRCYYGASTTNTATTGAACIVGATPGLGAILPAVSDLSAGGATLDDTIYENWSVAAAFDLTNNAELLAPTSPGWAFAPLGAPANCASTTALGAGCGPSTAGSFYENFATSAAFDLASTAITVTVAGGTRVVTPGGTYNAVGSLGTPTALVLTDDSQVAAGTLGLTVGSNGWVAFGAGNNNAFTPSNVTMLANPAAAYYSWHDLNPTIVGSGLVQYEEAGTLAQVTYDGVWDFGGTSAANANFIQFQIDAATGSCVIAWGATSTLGNGRLVGYSPAGASMDPGGIDISATLIGGPIVLPATDIGPLALAATSSPVLGTSWNLKVSSIPPSTVFGVNLFGVSDPGILDLFFLGMPMCQLRSSLDVIQGPWFPGGNTYNYSFPVPSTPLSLLGFQLYTQAATFGVPPVNAFGAITSGGVKGTVGF
ncbi:MAG TPA: hypothetical protein VFZ65_08915 [Planctomycetota bacterium]|nr:hypothetical protein [Planctomycetota bacterium]